MTIKVNAFSTMFSKETTETLISLSDIEKIENLDEKCMIYLKHDNKFIMVTDSFETLSKKLGVL